MANRPHSREYDPEVLKDCVQNAVLRDAENAIRDFELPRDKEKMEEIYASLNKKAEQDMSKEDINKFQESSDDEHITITSYINGNRVNKPNVMYPRTGQHYGVFPVVRKSTCPLDSMGIVYPHVDTNNGPSFVRANNNEGVPPVLFRRSDVSNGVPSDEEDGRIRIVSDDDDNTQIPVINLNTTLKLSSDDDDLVIDETLKKDKKRSVGSIYKDCLKNSGVHMAAETLYCTCKQPWDPNNQRFMIQCDNCKEWFHGSCVGVQERESLNIDRYHCPTCASVAGDSVSKDASHRSIRAGTKVFLEKLKEKDCRSADEIILKMTADQLTLVHLVKNGFTKPILVEDEAGLDLQVPDNTFSVRDVEHYVGSDKIVDVIDVQKQTDVKMTMKEFCDYFTCPERTKLYNLISLEFSDTDLSKLVKPPAVSRKLDWVISCWPPKDESTNDTSHDPPAVSKYCLISTKESFTDFHIDFGGTSVWYHILWGEKIFYLVEPTPTNLKLFEGWMVSNTQYETFFADMVDFCYRLVLKPKQTLFIPTGWIHGVLTTEDSLVFGGNFLHGLNIDMQLKIYGIEKRLNVPNKYSFPHFEALHWYAGHETLNDLKVWTDQGIFPQHLVEGSKALVRAYRAWSGEKTTAHEVIPRHVNPERLIKLLTREIRKADKRVERRKEPSQEKKKSKHHHHRHNHTTSSSSDKKCKKHHKSHRHHHKNKSHDRSHHSSKKDKREEALALDSVLAGTLNGMDKLFRDSNYTERLAESANTSVKSDSMKQAIAEMVENESVPLSRRLVKDKKRRAVDSWAAENIQQVHQDADFIYLPLAGESSDEETKSKKSNIKKQKKRNLETAEEWSPSVKMGAITKREACPSRTNAKVKAVEKGLENAAAVLEKEQKHAELSKPKEANVSVKKVKSKRVRVKSNGVVGNASEVGLNGENAVVAGSSSGVQGLPKKTTNKPKKGYATPKQRLGKILKLGKFKI